MRLREEDRNRHPHHLLCVDDLIIAGSLNMVIASKKAISKRFRMKDLGELRWVLGMEILMIKHCPLVLPLAHPHT